MPHRIPFAVIVLAVAVGVPARWAEGAACGCDKFSPGPAQALRSGGELRPTVASRGAEVVLFSDALVPGQEYVVLFTPIPRGARPGWGEYLGSVRGEATPRGCPPADGSDPVPDANPVAIEARDLADYQPLLSFDGSGPNLADVRQGDFPLRRQLRATVPCALPKLGGTRIDVYDTAGTPVLAAEEDEFTAIGDPLVVSPESVLEGAYVTGVDTTSHLYVALDLSQARDGLTLAGFAKSLALDIDPSDVAAFDVHGIYLDSLRDVLRLNRTDPSSQQLFGFEIIDATGRQSDEVAYFRHSFTDWAAQHLPPFGPELPGKFPIDPADPYWHLPDDVLHPFGSTHTDFDHLVIAVSAHWRRTMEDGTVVSRGLWPGSELRFPLHIESDQGNELARIAGETRPALDAAPGDAQWHRRGKRRHRHRHRHRVRIRKH